MTLDKLNEVFANPGGLVIKLAVNFGRGPFVPLVFTGDKGRTVFAFQLGPV